MSAPRQVQRRAEQARELARRNAEGRPMMDSQQPAPNQPQEQPAPQQANQPPVQETVEQETAFAPQSGPAEDWETRYKNLRNSRNEKLEAERQRAAELEARIAKLAASEDDAPQGVSQEEGVKSKPEAPVPQIEDDLAHRESMFFADVASIIPQWERLNADPKFLVWLSEKDGFSGRTRRDTLVAARSALDADTVTSLFSAYLTQVDNQDSEVAQRAPQQASVETGRSYVPPTDQQQAQIFTNAQIKAFYAEKNQIIRRKKMTPELAEKYAADDAVIRKAMQEGRVR